jgi:hypothetical protein
MFGAEAVEPSKLQLFKARNTLGPAKEVNLRAKPMQLEKSDKSDSLEPWPQQMFGYRLFSLILI